MLIEATAKRTSGVLLHPTSLPEGRLGHDAYVFVDWLAAAGQSWWQVLPLGPPDENASPYRPASAFAGSTALLGDPDARVEPSELDELVAREHYWIGSWAAYAGGSAVSDQARFQREWSSLRSYAAARGVRLIGDIPLYVAPGGADHLAHPELFQDGVVAGVPPDDWSRTGQLWGNPLYDWRGMRSAGYRWWIERVRRLFELVDLARIDHFRGFVAYWSVPESHRTALRGTWVRGPGRAPFDAIRAALGTLPFVAEDLGLITPAVERLRRDLDLPGMVVLQFLLSEQLVNSPMPGIATERNRVMYSGTHDNDTLPGWWAAATETERESALSRAEEQGIVEAEPHWALIRLTLASPARVAIVQAQDVLGLGSEARMNFPGTETGNWSWRLEPGQLDRGLAERLRRATEAAGRLRP